MIGLMVLLANVSLAQSSVLDTTRNWTSDENIELYSGQTLSDTFLITINSTGLTLQSGDITKNFQVENIQGAWTNLTETGYLDFEIPLPGFKGKGRLQNDGEVLSLTIDFSERKDWMKRKFIINQ